ncbi:hypothetical protein F5882DRAFT_135361 [Hyaloscypha sp. PMI_1271]|nr:hypothetical protein F5882DRAFT_135361 [Hyaloscypha sp. PMI_1271]
MAKSVLLTMSRPGSVPLEPLYLLFQNYYRAQCEDPRDRIFGLRSLAYDCCKEAIPVQYSLGWEGTLWNLLRHQIFHHPWMPRGDVHWSPPKSVVAKIHEIYRQSEEAEHYSTNNNSAEMFKAAVTGVARSIRYTTREHSPVVLRGYVRGRIRYLGDWLDYPRCKEWGLSPRNFTAMMKIQLKYIFDQCTFEDQHLSTGVSDRLRQPFGRDNKRRCQKYFSSDDGFKSFATGKATSLDDSTLSDGPISYQGSGIWTAQQCPETIEKELNWLLAAAHEAFPSSRKLAIEENGLVFFASGFTRIGDLVCQFPDSDIIAISSGPWRMGDVHLWSLRRAFNILASPSGGAVDICGKQMTFHRADRYAFSVELNPLDLWKLCRTPPLMGELDSLGNSDSSDISPAT